MFVVLGNAGIDESMRVESWPSPGQTVVVGAPRRDLGGKGINQAVVLHRAGAPVRFVAAIGPDADGDWVAATIAREGLAETRLVRVDHATDRSLIFVDRDGENAIASTTDAARSIDAAMAERIVSELHGGDVLLMQGNLTLAATRAALTAARVAGVRTIVNPSPIQSGFGDLIDLVDLLVLNEGEATLLGATGTPAETAAGLRTAGAGTVVLTLGERGAVLADACAVSLVPGLAVAAVDTTGAGDTFMGVLVAGLHYHGLPLDRAVAAANAAAALTVQRPGTFSAFPSVDEIDAIIRSI